MIDPGGDLSEILNFIELLELEPGNPQAVEGIADIGRRYAQMAEAQIRRGNYAAAETYLSEGLRVDPSNKQLQVLRSGVQIRERSFLTASSAIARFRCIVTNDPVLYAL